MPVVCQKNGWESSDQTYMYTRSGNEKIKAKTDNVEENLRGLGERESH